MAVHGDDRQAAADYRESIIRNIPFAAAYILFLIPYAGWVLGPAALIVEWLVALGDDRGMRIGDMLANTRVVQPEPDTAQTSHEPLSQSTAPLCRNRRETGSITVSRNHHQYTI